MEICWEEKEIYFITTNLGVSDIGGEEDTKENHDGHNFDDEGDDKEDESGTQELRLLDLLATYVNEDCPPYPPRQAHVTLGSKGSTKLKQGEGCRV